MSFVRANGLDVISLRLDLPPTGAWTAILELDTGDEATPSGAITIDFASDPTVSFVGHVVAPAAVDVPLPGRGRVFVRAGAAGMGAMLAGKPYADVSPLLVVEDIVSAAGETIGIVAPLDGLLARRLWLRPAGPAGKALSRFLAPAGLTWRMSPAGAVNIIAETWPAYSPDPLVEREADEQGRMVLALEAPDLYPGVSLFGRNVLRVVHTVAANGKFRTEAIVT